MNDSIFIDTNILVYAADRRDQHKMRHARTLLESFAPATPPVLSTQVLQEFYVALTRKLAVDPLDARSLVAVARQRSRVQSVPVEQVMQAVDCSILSQLSFWDALILVTASAAGCHYLWTEDLHPGQTINGVKIVNPFRS